MIGAGVLVVDDNPGVRGLIEAILEDAGCVVREATDAVEAISILSRRAWTPSVILLDLNLPGMSGTEVIDWVQTEPRLREVPIVIVSGLDVANAGQPCPGRPGVSVLPKPFGKAELVERVRQCVSYGAPAAAAA
jgi:CheY-like chemotaxis protein